MGRGNNLTTRTTNYGSAVRRNEKFKKPNHLASKLSSSLRRVMDTCQRAVLARYAEKNSALFFIQIGSNDAQFGDPIKSYIKERKWRGVMIEPVPYVFERLKQKYASDCIQTICCAISEQSGRYPFYSVEEDSDNELPAWYDQIGSFRKDVVLKHSDVIPELEKRIQEIDVDCLSYDHLLRALNVDKVNLLHVDAEGFDYNIVRQVKLDHCGPDYVIFEHKHMLNAQRDELLERFRNNGYRCLVGTSDVACVRRDALSLFACLLTLFWPQTWRS